jgi:hypothetical protein
MSSRFTVDTTYLKIRDVFAFNANSGEVIQRDSVPVIGDGGHIDWKSSLEFISTISIPTLSTNIVGALSLIQPGLSSLSTVYFSTTTSFIQSTVAGLGSLPNGNGYVSTSKLYNTVDHLTGQYGYVSSTMLYDCIRSLGNLSQIGGFLRLPTLGNIGYVSTINPGEYTIYQSTLQLNGSNASNIAIDNTTEFLLTTINIGGYMSHLVGPSKMRIDITTNLTLTHSTSSQREFELYLAQGEFPIGIPVIINYTGTSVYLPTASFLLKTTDIIGSGGTLQLFCYSDSISQGILNTLIPTIGGIHITLDNTD